MCAVCAEMHLLRRIACTQCMRCGLLLQVSHVAWSACLSACVCLCIGHTRELCKTAEPIEMPFGVLTRMGPMNHVGLLDGVEIRHGNLEGAFLGVVRLRSTEKHLESLLRCMQQNRSCNSH